MENKEEVNYIKKTDMVIDHISDCILKLDGKKTESGIPEMAKALAELIQARAYVEHLIGRPIEQ